MKKVKLKFETTEVLSQDITKEYIESINDEYFHIMYTFSKIWNDHLTIRWMFSSLRNNYKSPETDMSGHMGTYGGMNLYFNIMIYSFINEVSIFFEKNKTKQVLKKIKKEGKFKDKLKLITKDNRDKISSFIDDPTSFITNKKVFSWIRNNIGFHYHYAWSDDFITESKNYVHNDSDSKIYYSKISRSSIDKESRMYYADLINQKHFENQSAKLNNKGNLEKNKLMKSLMEAIIPITLIVNILHEIYFDEIKNA